MNSIAGPVSTAAASAGRSSRTPTTATASARVARAKIPTGVSGERPAGSNPGCVPANPVENFRRHQLLVEHDVGIPQRAQRLDGQEIGITWTRADQCDGTTLATAGKCRRIADVLQSGFGGINSAVEHEFA